ncbi:hypothetical protein ACSBR1_034951 [Camellia fascicularis]
MKRVIGVIKQKANAQIPLQKTQTRRQSKNPIVHATENGIIKLVKEILEIFPDAVYSFDKNGKNILHIAVEQKDRVLYDYLKKNVDHKDAMLIMMGTLYCI